MKYTVEIEINKSLKEVIALFDNEENAFKWMEGLVAWDHISGEKGAVGAKSKMMFKMKSREVEMVETILEKNLPQNMKMSYEAKGVYNLVNNRFEDVGNNKTRYLTEQEFQFQGFMMKFFGAIMPGMFKKQSMKYLNDFKAFAEGAE